MYKRNFRVRRRMRRRGVRAAAYKALKKVNRLSRRIKPELKYEDAYIGSYQTVNWSGYTSALLANAQGTSYNQHIGQRMAIKYIDLNYSLSQPNAGAYSDTKVVLYVDKMNTNPSVFGVSAQPYAPLAPLYRVEKPEYRVLHEQNHAQTTGTHSGFITVRKRINMKDLVVDYAGNTTTHITNQLRIAAISGSSVSLPSILWYARIVYTDV